MSAVIYFYILFRSDEKDQNISGTSLTFAAVLLSALAYTFPAPRRSCRQGDWIMEAINQKEADRRGRAGRHGPRPARRAFRQRRCGIETY